jgi:hypothetical protein
MLQVSVCVYVLETLLSHVPTWLMIVILYNFLS